MKGGELKDAINGLFGEDRTRDYVLVSKTIGRDLHDQLSLILDQNEKNDNVTLFLTTYGGDPDRWRPPYYARRTKVEFFT